MTALGKAQFMTEEQKNSLYPEYHKKILGYIYNRVLNTDTAEDLCSLVFLKIYEKLDTFDETKASLSTWIFTVMRNTLFDYYRAHRVSEEIPEDLSDGKDLEEEVINRETLSALADALCELPEKQRDVIILRYYKGEKLKDAAVMMGISYPYAKLLHKQAIESLKLMLKEL